MPGRGVPVTDYYSILSRAVAALDPNTARARDALYDRARRVIMDSRQADPAHGTSVQGELSSLDAAIDRIEAGIAEQQRAAPYRRDDSYATVARAQTPPIRAAADRRSARGRGPLWAALAAAIVLLSGVAGGYLYFADRPAVPKQEPQKAVTQKQEAKREAIAAEELAPGVDGGSSDQGLPYPYRRQLVYYRTTYSPGMIVVDRSQRFLHLIEPQIRAIRYGIGIGGECGKSEPGLRRISRVVEWPEWRPSEAVVKQKQPQTYQSLPGGPGNPLGARAIYFEDGELGIHGTNAPRSIGQAVTLGCFRMVNDDVVDFAKRAASGAGVVVMN